MTEQIADPGLDTLLDLDGQTYVIDEAGHYWVKFQVERCEISPERPHGLRYSLTLHGPRNERLVGFDNAHAISAVKGPAKRSRQKHDHKHRLKTVKPYEYRDAAALLEDFWNEVDKMLKERGVET